MEETFVDTSGLYAYLVRSDAAHGSAVAAWRRLVESAARLVTSSYVLCESHALTRRRHGPAATTRLRRLLLPVRVVWIDEELHGLGLDRLDASGDPDLSLVDATSFVVAERFRVTRAFAFDRHFDLAGFGRP